MHIWQSQEIYSVQDGSFPTRVLESEFSKQSTTHTKHLLNHIKLPMAHGIMLRPHMF